MNPNQLDKVLYGKILEGNGPWPEGPKAIARKKFRLKLHEFAFGKDGSCNSWPCPVCSPVSIDDLHRLIFTF